MNNYIQTIFFTVKYYLIKDYYSQKINIIIYSRVMSVVLLFNSQIHGVD